MIASYFVHLFGVLKQVLICKDETVKMDLKELAETTYETLCLSLTNKKQDA